MARNKPADAVVADPEVNPEVTEDVVEPTPDAVTPVGGEAPAEGSEAPESEGPSEEAKLAEFERVLNAGLNEADADTGTIAEVFKAPIVAAYKELDAKSKRKVKGLLQEALKVAVGETNMGKAQGVMFVTDALAEVGTKTKETKEPVDPTEAFVGSAVALRSAYDVFASDVPEGVAADWRDRAAALRTELGPQFEAYAAHLKAVAEAKDGEAPTEPEGISEVVKAAYRIASGKGVGLKRKGKATGPRPAHEGPTRSIGKHILEAFDGKPEGTFMSVADIRNFKSSEYGDTVPSSGAISARLFPSSGKCTVEGIRPGEQDKKKGAFKA